MNMTTALDPPRRYSWIRVTSSSRCPICESPQWCGVTEDGGLCHCMKVESANVASDGGWLHSLNGTAYARPEPMPKASIPELPLLSTRLSPDRNDAIAKELLAILTLDTAHRKAFNDRGIDDKDISRHGYRSLRRKEFPSVMKALRIAFPVDDIMRLPGMIRRKGRYGPYLTINAPDGILIPVRDLVGFIVGFRIRPDPIPGAGPQSGGKYRWLSSPDGGVSSGAPIHVARPTKKALRDENTVYVVEGEIKANIVADRMGTVTISVPGVTITAGVLPAVMAMLPGKIGNVVIAYDCDKHDPMKPSILIAERKLAKQVAPHHRVFEAKWLPELGKGLDDMMVAGHNPIVAPYPIPAAPIDMAEGMALDAAIEAQALELANAAWSVEPVVRGKIVKSKWCSRGRNFFMGGSGRITDVVKTCGRWTCGYCAVHKLTSRLLPHIAMLWQRIEEEGGFLWVGRRGGDKDAFGKRVCRYRREGGHPKYISIVRHSPVTDEDIIDLSGHEWIVATEDLSGRDDEWECMPPLDAYLYLREHILCVPGVKHIRFCDAWMLPEVPKVKCEDHIAYTSPTIMEKKFAETAREAQEATGILPVYREDIPNPEARQIVHDGCRSLRSGHNNQDWGELCDEEHHA